ncbi:MAG: YitT family protein [Candidatus Omnitrophota bacterium]|jgi:uncharacterized membrane-anchored protein YitT (DUF2179 family)
MMKKTTDFLYQTFLIASGSFLCALGIRSLIMPHDLLSQGLTGLSLLIYYQGTPLSLSTIYLLINIPVFILGWWFVSRRFIFYSLWGMVIYATALSIVNIKINVSDPMLAVMIGGALNGLGVALILRSYGSSGGSEILCVVMNKLFSITVGTGAILINIAVLVPAALFFSVEKVFYTLVFVFVSGMFTNKIFHGMAKRRTAVIVSNQWAAIASALREQKIGVTFLKGQGSFLAEERMLLYSVLVARSVPTLKRIVAEVDPAAFISIMEAADVTGVEVGNQPHW